MRMGRTIALRAAFGQERGEIVFETLHTLDGRATVVQGRIGGPSSKAPG